jgi:agmatine deiminase
MKLWFSRWLTEGRPYRAFYKRFAKALEANGVMWGLLEETKDIWCRDYMPVWGAGGIPVLFRYEPSYLRKLPHYRTDAERVLWRLGLQARRSSLNFDGGNVLLHDTTAIVSDRIFGENPRWSEREVKRELIESLELDRLILLPAESPRYDMTGHADGMCRFIDGGRILLNDFSQNLSLGRRILRILEREEFDVERIVLGDSFYDETTDWAPYINYLKTSEAIFVPTLGKVGEGPLLARFETIFQGHRIVPVRSDEIVREGGGLNCISWEGEVDDVA